MCYINLNHVLDIVNVRDEFLIGIELSNIQYLDIKTETICLYYFLFNINHDDVTFEHLNETKVYFRVRCKSVCTITESSYRDKRYNMSRVARKCVFRVSDQAQHKPGCMTT